MLNKFSRSSNTVAHTFTLRAMHRFVLILVMICVTLRAFSMPLESPEHPTSPTADSTISLSAEVTFDHADTPCADHPSEMDGQSGSQPHQSCQIHCAIAGAPMLLPSFPLFAKNGGEAHTLTHPLLLQGIRPLPDLRPPIA